MSEQGRDKSGAVRWARLVLVALYALAGFAHLSQPDIFLTIMPGAIPFPRQVVLATGLCEIVGAVALLLAPLRRWAGLALAVYAVAVFPANIKHALDDARSLQPLLGWWYHGPRLALQPVLVWWALFAGELVRWPFGRRPSGG